MAKSAINVPKVPSWDEWVAGTGLAAENLVNEAKRILSILPDGAGQQEIEERLGAFLANVFTNELPRLRGTLITELPKFVATGKGPVAKSPTDGVI